MPIGLRVSEKLTLDYPELLELEAPHVEKELAIAKESLSARVKGNDAGGDIQPHSLYQRGVRPVLGGTPGKTGKWSIHFIWLVLTDMASSS